MGNEDYRKAYESAAKELEQLVQQQERTEDRILALRKTMNVLSTLCQQEGVDLSEIDKRHARLAQIIEGSVTEDILKVISAASGPMTTSEVREELNKLGGSMAEQSNPLATINAVLNRLTEQDRVKETVKDGRKAWGRRFVPLSNLTRAGSGRPRKTLGQLIGEKK